MRYLTNQTLFFDLLTTKNKKFDPLDRGPLDAIEILRSLSLLIVIVFGVIENLYVLIYYIRSKTWRKRIFEMTQSLLGMAFSSVNLYYFWRILIRQNMHGNGCLFYAFVSSSTALLSVYQPVLLAMEWCVIIQRPFCSKVITWRHRFTAVVCTTLIVLSLTVPPVFGFPTSYKKLKDGDFCCYDFSDHRLQTRVFFGYLFGFGFFIPTAVFVLSAYLMRINLRASADQILLVTPTVINRNGKATLDKSDTYINVFRKHRSRRQEQAIFTKMFVLTVVQIVCWLPFALLTYLTSFTEIYAARFATDCSSLFSKMFVIVSPVILYVRDIRLSRRNHRQTKQISSDHQGNSEKRRSTRNSATGTASPTKKLQRTQTLPASSMVFTGHSVKQRFSKKC